MAVTSWYYEDITIDWILNNAGTFYIHECDGDSKEVTMIFEGEENVL